MARITVKQKLEKRDSCISGPKYCSSCKMEANSYTMICNHCGVVLSRKISKKKKRKFRKE